MALGAIVMILLGSTGAACGTSSAVRSTPSKSIKVACDQLDQQGAERADSDGYAYFYDTPPHVVDTLHDSGNGSLSHVGTVLVKASRSGNSALFNTTLSTGKSICRSLGS